MDIELKTYYCFDDKGKEIIWGRIMDFQEIQERKIAMVYVGKNPLGSRIVPILLSQVESFIEKGQIWRKKK